MKPLDDVVGFNYTAPANMKAVYSAWFTQQAAAAAKHRRRPWRYLWCLLRGHTPKGKFVLVSSPSPGFPGGSWAWRLCTRCGHTQGTPPPWGP